jgi:hypothetical protein
LKCCDWSSDVCSSDLGVVKGGTPDIDALFSARNFEQLNKKGVPEWQDRFRKVALTTKTFTPKQVDQTLDFIQGFVNIFKANKVILPYDASTRKVFNKKGELVDEYLNAVVNNADFGKTFDVDRACQRTKQYYNSLEEIQKRLGKILTPEEMMQLGQYMRSSGDIPFCVFCYVEAGRRRAQDFKVKFARGTYDPKTMKKGYGNGKDITPSLAENIIERDRLLKKLGWSKETLEKKMANWEQFSTEASKNTDVKELFQIADKYIKSSKGTLYTPVGEYNQEIINFKDSQIKEMNDRAGIRMLSATDFDPTHLIQVLQGFAHATTRGLMGHAYSKDPYTILVLSPAGLKGNMSISADGRGGKSGNSFSSDYVNGMDWRLAKKLREKYPNAGTMFVAKNNEQLKWALKQDWIDMIIPHHAANWAPLDPKVFELDDFSSYQHEDWSKERPDKYIPKVMVKGELKSVSPKDHFGDKLFFKPYLMEAIKENPKLDYKEQEKIAVKKYLDFCKKEKIIPKFSTPAFLNRIGMKDFNELLDNGYAKLLKDYARSDTPQTPLDIKKIDQEWAKKYLDQFIEKGGRNEISKPNKKTVDEFISDYKKSKLKPIEEHEKSIKLDQKKAPNIDLIDEIKGPQDTLNKEAGGIKKASVEFKEDGKAIIRAFSNANVYDIAHELGHVFRRRMNPEDLKSVEEWAGVKDGIWTRDAEEKFAKGFETYLSIGKAPNPKMQSVFDDFKKWASDIYLNIKDDLNIDISPEARAVFDKMTAGEEISKKKEAEPLNPEVPKTGTETAQGGDTTNPPPPPTKEQDFSIPSNENLKARDQIVVQEKWDKLKDDVRYYKPITEKQTQGKALDIINNYGRDTAENLIRDRSVDMQDALREAIAGNLVDMYSKEGNASKELSVLEYFAEHGTDIAQGLRMRRLYTKLSPAAQVLSAEKQKINGRAAFIRANQEKITKLEQELNRVHQESVDLLSRLSMGKDAIIALKQEIFDLKKQHAAELAKNIADNPVVIELQNKLKEAEKQLEELKSRPQQTTESPAKKKLLDSVEKRRVERDKQVESARKRLQALKLNVGGQVNDVAYVLGAKIYNRAIDTIDRLLVEGKSATYAIDKAVAEIYADFKDKWNEGEFRDIMLKAMGKIEEDPYSKVVKKELKELGIKIDKIVTEHYLSQNHTKEQLIESLKEKSGITEEEAKQYAEKVDAAFEKIATERKEKVIEKILKKNKNTDPNQWKKQLDEIIKASNLGILSNEQLANSFADLKGFGELTKEQRDTIYDLAQKAQTAKGRDAKFATTDDLLRYMSKMKGMDWAEVAKSVWYANMLSGPSTQALNIYANHMETFSEIAVTAIQELAKAIKSGDFNSQMSPWQLMKAWSFGIKRGAVSAQSVWETGYDPAKGLDKVQFPSLLEYTTFKGGVFNPFNAIKYVRRFMSAADVFSYRQLQEIRSAQLAYSMASARGLDSPTKEISARANEILGLTSEQIANARQQATDEGLTGLAHKKRTLEIIEESRPEEMNEDANDFAAHGTFNYKPEGVLGGIVNALNDISSPSKFPMFKAVVPFTTIVGNVANRYLDWTPYGYVRAMAGGIGASAKLGDKIKGAFGSTDKSDWFKEYTGDQRAREIIKATLGTLNMAAMYFLAGDDDKSLFEITATGPKIKGKQYEEQQRGWTPYSIRIGNTFLSYKNTPMAIPFSIIGKVKDMKKYNGEDDISLSSKIALSTFAGMQFFTDMTFLQSMDSFMNMFSSTDPTSQTTVKLEQWFNRTTKSFVVPNLYTQTAQLIEEIFDLPQIKADNFLKNMVKDIPVIRQHAGKEIYNALGEPVTPKMMRKLVPFMIHMTPKERQKIWDNIGVEVTSGSKAWNIVFRNNEYIGLPSKQSVIPFLNEGPVADENGTHEGVKRLLTEDEYAKYALKSAQMTRKMLEENYDYIMSLPAGTQGTKQFIRKLKLFSRKAASHVLFNGMDEKDIDFKVTEESVNDIPGLDNVDTNDAYKQ